MAADTRKRDNSGSSASEISSKDTPARDQNPNVLARPNDYSVVDAVKAIGWEDFRTFHQKPCVRDALLTGIGVGFGVGGLRAIFGAAIPKASNWAAGAFIFATLGQYQYCQVRRRVEKDGLRRAMEIMNRKRQDKEAKSQEMRDARRQRKLEAEKKSEEAREAQQRRSRSWKAWGGQADKAEHEGETGPRVPKSTLGFWGIAGEQTEGKSDTQIKRSPFWNMTPEELEQEVHKQRGRDQEAGANEQNEQQPPSSNTPAKQKERSRRLW